MNCAIRLKFVCCRFGTPEIRKSRNLEPLFETYEQGVGVDRKFLATLEANTEKLGVQAIRGGERYPRRAEGEPYFR